MTREIEVLAKYGAQNLSVYWRMYGSDEWLRCPPSFHDLTSAKDYARTVRVPDDAVVRVVEHAWDHHRRDRMVTRLKGYELELRGLVRSGALDVRAATDDELDVMWRPKSRVARRLAAPDREPARTHVDLPKSRVLRSLRLEFVGQDLARILRIRGMKPWVARPTFDDDGEIVAREFAEGGTDYADADKLGVLGVMLCFTLPQGVPFEVFDRARSQGPRRVFMLHDGQQWLDITKECAIRCAR